MAKLMFVVFVCGLLFTNSQALSLSSLSNNYGLKRNGGRIETFSSRTRLLLKSDLVVDEPYDYDELFYSAAEQERLSTNYVKFGHENWLQHRATDRFYRNLLKFPSSPIVQGLIDEVAVVVVISLMIILWNELVVDGYTDFSGVYHHALFSDLPQIKLVLPMDLFFLSGGPLGLLLVFRTDVSFGRYREAFHLWETIVSHFSSMLLIASNASPSNVEGVRNMGIACWALCRTLQHEVLGKFDPTEKYEKDIRRNIPNKEQAERLLNARNKIYRAQYDIHQSIEPFTEEITALDKRTLINSVNAVGDACGECERLYTTPIPLLYTRHTLKFLSFWMIFMPFGLYEVFRSSWNHALMIPAIAILTFLFFGIEEIAVSMEEPFSILPLNELVKEVRLCIDDVTEWMTQQGNLGLESTAKNQKHESASN